MIPWNVATVAPPRHLPMTIADMLTGGTSISRRNPNSRSQTIEAAEKMAVNSTDMASTPGYTNVLKLMPGGSPCPASEDRPVPRTNRNNTGWTRLVTARSRSLLNLISSRYQTMRTARRSWRSPRSGTETRIAAVTGSTPWVVSWAVIGGLPPSPHRHHHAAVLVARGRLGVPDRPPGVGHE